MHCATSDTVLQPLTHEIKRASARSSHRCLLRYPLLPLHSMLKVAKLFPFGGGTIKRKLFTHNLDPRGYRGLCFIFVLLHVRKHKIFKSCKMSSSHRPRSTLVSLLYTCSAPQPCMPRLDSEEQVSKRIRRPRGKTHLSLEPFMG
jgi:hypothetical protein